MKYHPHTGEKWRQGHGDLLKVMEEIRKVGIEVSTIPPQELNPVTFSTMKFASSPLRNTRLFQLERYLFLLQEKQEQF